MPRSSAKNRRAEMLPWLLLFGALSMLVLTVVVGRLYLKHQVGSANQSADAARQATQDLTQRLRAVEAEKALLEEQLLQAEKPASLTTPLPDGQVSRLSSAQEELVMRLREELRSGKVETQRTMSELRVVFASEVLFEDSAGAGLSRAGEELLLRLASVVVRGRDKQVQVATHAVAAVLEGKAARAHATGWELSSARALTVARFLSERGQVPPGFVVATAKVGTPGQAPAGKGVASSPNRVELIVTEAAWGDALAEAAAPAASATPPRASRRKSTKSKAARKGLVSTKAAASR